MSVQTMFVYYPRGDGQAPGMVKFQRVRGRATNPPADVYHVAAPSLLGQAQSYTLVPQGGGLHPGAALTAFARGAVEETWHEVNSAQVDSLVIAHCPDGNPPEGDYLWIDVPKYTADTAHVQIVFLSPRGLEMADDDDRESRLWEVTHSLGMVDENGDGTPDIPVVFNKRLTRGLRRRTGATGPIPDLDDWFAALDALVSAPPPNIPTLAAARALVEEVVKTLANATDQPDGTLPSAVLNGTAFPNLCQFQAPGLTNPVLAVVQWSPAPGITAPSRR